METSVAKVQLQNGETYAYREFGIQSSKTLLYLHSAYFSSAFMSKYLNQLSDEFHVYAPDFRGHGHSSYNKPLNEVEDLVEDIKDFVDALGLRRFDLVGWSLGGATAMKFAARYPDYVNKIVLLASGGAKGIPTFKTDEHGAQTTERAKTDQEVLDSSFGKLLPQVRGQQDRGTVAYLLGLLVLNGRNKPTPEEMEKYLDEFFLCRCHERTLVALNKYNISDENNDVVDGTNELAKIKSRVLILHGEKDGIVSSKDAEDLKKRFQDQDQAELRLFEEAGHALVLDYPEEIISAMRGFYSS